jgi:hypothetical protein
MGEHHHTHAVVCFFFFFFCFFFCFFFFATSGIQALPLFFGLIQPASGEFLVPSGTFRDIIQGASVDRSARRQGFQFQMPGARHE